MRQLVEDLCSDRCAGRAPGTPGGRAARALVVAALRDAGLDPHEQEVPACGGANVLATLPGDVDRWILVAAHHDHLGAEGPLVFRGADDNAAAVAILVETARALAQDRARGRGVILAAFDGEEPPHFRTAGMGSEHFARHPIVPLDRIDLMVCMDLVGHALGDPVLPAGVRETLFALGAERSLGTAERVDALPAVPGVTVRRADAEVIPALSDYWSFWERRRPFMLLTGGRSRVYHTPHDTPDRLDHAKMAATAAWLTALVRDQRDRDEPRLVFQQRRDDVSTLDSLVALAGALAPFSDLAARGLAMARKLRGQVRADGSLPDALRPAVDALVAGLEDGLA